MAAITRFDANIMSLSTRKNGSLVMIDVSVVNGCVRDAPISDLRTWSAKVFDDTGMRMTFDPS